MMLVAHCQKATASMSTYAPGILRNPENLCQASPEI